VASVIAFGSGIPAFSASTNQLRSYLEGHRAAGTRLFAYGAASKAVAELAMMGEAAGAILAVGDASPAKQGRCMPGSRVPVISPAELIAADPEEVLLLLPDLHDELLATHPQLTGRITMLGADIPRTSPSLNASGCVVPGRWPRNRRCCWQTRRPAPLTPKPRRKCLPC